MNDFIFHNPAKVYFGKNQIENLPTELLKYGNKVLLVYGGGSIKKNGLYDTVTKMMKENQIEWFELSGVEPNPRHSTVNKGAAICKKENIDVILAVGGGSTIDCSKGIAATVLSDTDDIWEIVKRGQMIDQALPIVTILTNAATGSEMDMWAVISNMDTNEKLSFGGAGVIPRVAFENPEDTYSLPTYQTACGSFDIFSHVLDNYYLAGDSSFEMVQGFQEAVMRAVVKYAPIAIQDPTNYEARANLMWASSMALNDILNAGMMYPAACHLMEHELSAYYDITHGHGLAIVTPRWLTYILDEDTAPEICRLGEQVFGIEKHQDVMAGAKKAIEAVSEFCFNALGLKSTLTELGITDEHFRAMAEHVSVNGPITGVKELSADDVENIYRMCM